MIDFHKEVKSYHLGEEEKEEVIERLARMLNNEIYKIANGEWLYETVNNHEVIYSLMYGETHVDWRTTEDQIITIKTEELEWSESKNNSFMFGVGLGQILIFILQKIMEKLGLFLKKN